MYRLCSYIHSVRRTDEHNLRQAISEILEQTYAIEYSMGLLYRRRSLKNTMRGAVERPGAIVACADQQKDAQPKVAQAVE